MRPAPYPRESAPRRIANQLNHSLSQLLAMFQQLYPEPPPEPESYYTYQRAQALGVDAGQLLKPEQVEQCRAYEEALQDHIVPDEVVAWMDMLRDMQIRSQQMASHLEEHLPDQLAHPSLPERAPTRSSAPGIRRRGGPPELKEMIADGRIKIGERVYVNKYPTRFATIVDEEGNVEFEGEVYAMSVWGRQINGWTSINIYDSVFLERTGEPLRSLRR
jgi:hypothetical protein